MFSSKRRWVLEHGRVLVMATAVAGSATAWWLYGLGGSEDLGPCDARRPSVVVCGTAGVAEPADEERVEIPVEGLPHKGAEPGAGNVTMVVCSDFECPYSRRASATVDELLARNDDLSFYYLHLPLKMFEHAMIKAMAGAAAHRQGAFWTMHDALYTAKVDSPKAATELARRLGLDAERFAADLRDPSLRAEVERQRTVCRDAGVRGVPTFFINGRRFVGSQPAEAFQRVIDEERR
jgi:protein-disulfide isomerase